MAYTPTHCEDKDGDGNAETLVGHTLDGQAHHGFPKNDLGLRTCLGTDPAGAGDFFSLDQSGNLTGGDFRKVYSGNSTLLDNFAAGTAFIVIRRSDAKGLQLSSPGDHAMIATVAQGLSGWVWTSPGVRVYGPCMVNPVWIAVNMVFRARGLDNPWPSQWWSMGHAKRSGPNEANDLRKVTIKYSATEQHDLYLGTFLNTDCGKVAVTVDGVAPAESPVDLYLVEYGGTTANVKIASAVPAGNHTVVLTPLFDRNADSTGYYFYFDYLWPLVPQDVPDPQRQYSDVSLAIDFDTDHGYKKPPAWHLWHLRKLGFNDQADVHMGVFWNNKRRRAGASYPYATIEYRLADGAAAPHAGDVVTISLSGSGMQHTVLDGESLQDIVDGMRVLINQFSGVWADDNYGSSTTLRIQSKAPSWTFPGMYVDDGKATLGGYVNEPFAITAGVNDALLFTFGGDGGQQVTVTLTAGAARTGAEVAGEFRRRSRRLALRPRRNR